MPHRDINTAMRYVSMPAKMKKSAEAVYVPPVALKMAN